MPGIGTKVVHVLTNNLRRRRYRLAGGATVLAAIVCLTLLLSSKYNGRPFQGRAAAEDVEEIQREVPGASRRVTSPQGQRQTPGGGSINNNTLSPKLGRETPPTNHSSGRIDRGLTPPLVPSLRMATLSPHNPCGANTFPKRPPDDLKESFTWQKLSEEGTNTYVFSAHHDPREGRRAVVIVGISSDYMGSGASYACQIWFAKAGSVAEVTSVEGYSHSETHGRRYGATFYTCKYQSNESLPFAVSLVPNQSRCRSPFNVLKISPFDRSTEPVVNFTVCVTPLNYNFDNFRLLVDMVELNRMFGASHVIFYNYTTGSQVVPYFRSYETDGVVKVVPWKLPVLVDVQRSNIEPEIHYFGQLAALNDCVYRSMFRSRYVVLTDLDEIVVPRKHGTWMEMMESEGKSRRSDWKNSIASFHLRNVFFRTDYGEDELYSSNATVSGLRLRSLLFTTREETTFPHGWRSKHIVNPEAVLFVGVHHIESILDNSRYSVMDVDEGAALLHHYRSWAGEETSRQISKTDRYMHGFNHTILSRVKGVHETVRSRFPGVATLEELTTKNLTHSLQRPYNATLNRS